MTKTSEQYDVGSDKGEAEAGHKSDLYLARKQADLLVEQLREEGRELAASIVEELDQALARASRDLEEVRDELAELKAGAKSSRGRERAGAAGTINKGGKAVHGRGIAPPKGVKAPNGVNHKHTFSDDGICHKLDGAGGLCGAKRQRKARAPKQTSIPGTNGAEAVAGAGS